jgi:hypothetical protein
MIKSPGADGTIGQPSLIVQHFDEALKPPADDALTPGAEVSTLKSCFVFTSFVGRSATSERACELCDRRSRSWV